MSSRMPERDSPGQWGGNTREQERAGAPAQRGAPGQEHLGEEQFGQAATGRVPGQPQGPGYQGGYQHQPYQQQPQPGHPWGQQHAWERSYRGGPGMWQPGYLGGESPVSREQTNVVGRRVGQYIVDYVFAGIIPGIANWVFNRGHGVLHGFGWLIALVISLAVYFWYWVLRPASHNGQTWGMQLFGLRVISKDGGPASMVQLFVRGVLLLVDTLFFGLVGLVSMLVSHYHQRVGDHAAGTLVVGTNGGNGGFGTWSGGGRQFGHEGINEDFEPVGAGRAGERDEELLAGPDGRPAPERERLTSGDENLSAEHKDLGPAREQLTGQHAHLRPEHERVSSPEEAQAAKVGDPLAGPVGDPVAGPVSDPVARPVNEGAAEHLLARVSRQHGPGQARRV